MNDPIVQEIRKIRDAHAAKFNFDFEAIARDWVRQDAAARRAGFKFIDLSAKSKLERRCAPALTE